ncbi:MAG TPA: OmpA family protein [Candidatus Krumholzibacteria bacterium]|nr:OmpA family protein [Candidatus Krumholzibacteria bacterium]HPD71788.1 OmpA family protein [Candidatus Krumholzibacteria bacterium]HRY41279.1 OmpA family protein [Candidatus Krumholzibacteria bacterium]
MKRLLVFLLVLTLVLTLAACGAKYQKRGTAIGAGAGAVIGGIIGHQSGNTALGAVIGAAVGGAAGAYIGNYMDDQAAEMDRDLEGAKIERVGEGIIITFESGLLFAVDQSSLNDQAKQNLGDLAAILNKYDDTNILVEGHTDSSGDEAYNDQLSVRRGEAVANYLAFLQVASERFSVVGYGESQPVADNATPEGRALNRRVEVAVYANDDLKAAAERQAAGG